MKFIAVTNDALLVEDLVNTLLGIEPYIDHVIIREKSKSREQLLRLFECLSAEDFPMTKCIVHSEPALALKYNMPFVQLPSSNDQLQNFTEQYPELQYGKSVHQVEEAIEAQAEGAAFVLYGHIFPTHCKKNLEPRGIDAVLHLLEKVDIPLYVIGGILPKHLSALQDIGVAGVAIMSTIFDNDNPVSMARKYKESIDKRGGQ